MPVQCCALLVSVMVGFQCVAATVCGADTSGFLSGGFHHPALKAAEWGCALLVCNA